MNRAPHHLSLRRAVRALAGVAAFCAMAAQTLAYQSAPAQTLPAAAVQITPSTMAPGSTSIDVGADSWIVRGFDLRTLIAQVYDIDARRVDLPDSPAASARYDVTLTLPDGADADAIQQMLADALNKKFGLTITPETRTLDVYVLTAPNGPGPALHRHAASPRTARLLKRASLSDDDLANDPLADASRITYSGKECSGVAAGGISAIAATLPDFRRTLEPELDRLLVDDTHLGGSYDFQIGTYRSQQELFDLLRARLGVVVTPAQRSVTVLDVEPEKP
jgi:uncharacterized protein (TIGR03435 family)